MKSAVIFGASGFVGSHLLSELLHSAEYGTVIAVARKSLNITHPRLRTVLADFQSLAAVRSEIVAEDVFLALGTTRASSPQQAEYYQVDHDYPVLAARIAKEAGASSVFLVTAVGANPASRFFYVRTKGETERDVIALNFAHTHIFRPSMIMGKRKENRSLLEAALMRYGSALNPLLPWQGGRYKGVTGEELAKAMILSAGRQTGKLQIYYWRDMHDLLQR